MQGMTFAHAGCDGYTCMPAACSCSDRLPACLLLPACYCLQVSMYSMHGTKVRDFSLGATVEQERVLRCLVCETGLVVLTQVGCACVCVCV